MVVLLEMVSPRGNAAQWLVNSKDYSVLGLGVSLDCLFSLAVGVFYFISLGLHFSSVK